MHWEEHYDTFQVQYCGVLSLYLVVCGKVELILEQAMKVQRGCRDIALLFL